MATILFCWELGGGTGHVVNVLPIARGLLERGHRVCVAARDIITTRRVLQDLDVEIYPAAIQLGRPTRPVNAPYNFAHILHNTGFESPASLGTLVSAWRRLYDAIAPDVLVFEHAPSALLASRWTTARRALLGTGFFAPPDVSPLPDLRPTRDDERNDVELRVLTTINGVLTSDGQLPIERVAQLYAEVDANYLLTFQELDHYPDRQGGAYYGMWSPEGGLKPEWPSDDGPRVFAYLKGDTGNWKLSTLLGLLSELDYPTLACIDGAIHQSTDRTSPKLKVSHERYDMEQLSRNCDLAILNGNAGTATQLLLAGVPQFHLPLTLEQDVFCRRLVAQGVGVVANRRGSAQLAVRLMRTLEDERLRTAATAFAQRYASHNPNATIADIVGRLDGLLIEQPT